MLRLSIISAIVLAGIGSVQAAECSVALQKRWEAAVWEATQIEKLPWRTRYDASNIALQCRMRDAMVEFSSAAKEYFPACDPLRADRAHVVVTKAEDALAKFDASQCAKPRGTARKKK